jgi:hypothetical protein
MGKNPEGLPRRGAREELSEYEEKRIIYFRSTINKFQNHPPGSEDLPALN